MQRALESFFMVEPGRWSWYKCAVQYNAPEYELALGDSMGMLYALCLVNCGF